MRAPRATPRAPCGRCACRADTSRIARRRVYVHHVPPSMRVTSARASRRRARPGRSASHLPSRSGLKCTAQAGSLAQYASKTSAPTSNASGPIAGPIHAAMSPGGNAHRGDGRFEHAGGEPAPSGMRDARRRCPRDRREHGQAVRGAHRERDVGRARHGGIRRRRGGRLCPVDVDARIAVHLREPDRVGRQRGAQALARHVDRPRREERAYARRPLPLRRRALEHRPPLRVVNSASTARAIATPARFGAIRPRERPSGSCMRAQRGDQRLEVRGQRRLPLHRSAGDRMHEAQPLRMQRLPCEARALAAMASAATCDGPDRSGRRPADDRARRGARGSGACARSRAGSARASRSPKRSTTSTCVRAGLPRVDHRHRRALRRMAPDRRIDRHVARDVAVDDARDTRA